MEKISSIYSTRAITKFTNMDQPIVNYKFKVFDRSIEKNPADSID
jgi:hypothetical protein